MATDAIRFTLADGVATLTLDKPDRLNSLDDAMHVEIVRVLDQLEADPALRVLVITGTGRAFCAGQDQTDRKPLPDGQKRDMGASLERFYKPLVLRLRALPVPVVCAMNGLAVGVGATLALACDLVIAKRSAYFTQGFTKLGLMPDGGMTQFLPQRVGPARALGLAWLNEKVSAEQAEAWGLIWRCVDDDAFDAAVADVVAQLARAATRALAATKQAVYAAADNTLAQQLDLEIAAQRALGETADYAEGAAAFREKRPPKFQGH
jgi:2-(1,2-epoxy-1,2-dihydrophenyl)acetyl-CoA isomerase